MDFSAAWVLTVQSELWDLWDCVAGRDESAASMWTGKAVGTQNSRRKRRTWRERSRGQEKKLKLVTS